MGTLGQGEKRSTYHGKRVAERDEADAALGIHGGPPGERKLCRILAEDSDVAPTLACKALAGDIEEGFTEVDEIDGVELRDGKVLIHQFNVVT